MVLEVLGLMLLKVWLELEYGNFILIDNDVVNYSNINRQVIATYDNIGHRKIDVEKKRILSINPKANVTIFDEFFLPESKEIFDKSVDYIVDAVDTISAKIEIVVRAKRLNVPIISCMGTANKLDPTLFEISDIYKTSVCPVAKVMRKELKSRNIDSLKVVFSREESIKSMIDELYEGKKKVHGSVSFVPSVAGLIIAGEVVKDLIK